MLQEVAELLALTVVTVVTVGSLGYSAVFHVSALSPCSGDVIVVGIISVHQAVLHSGVSHAHEIVEADAGSGDETCSPWCMLHGRQEDLEPIGKYAKCILHHTTSPGEPVVEDPLLPRQPSLAVGLLNIGTHGKGIVT